MLHRSVVVLTAIAFGVLAPAGALAQPAQPPAAGATDVLPPAAADGNAPAGQAADDKKPPHVVTPAAGYAYSDKPSASSASGASAPRAHYRSHGPVVNMPGFEQSADGGSRLFVQLSQSVKVEERKAQGSITYVLKGASPRVWNNTNALVTVHFNTPVSRARLVPVGPDLHFIVELRAAVVPTWKVDESQDKTAMLAIDFPKGDYLAGGTTETVASTAATTPKPAHTLTRRANGSRQGRGGRPPAPAPAAPPSDPKP